MPGAPCRKAYVAVNLDVDEEGNLYPRAIRWRDGRVFVIEQLKYKCRAASAKVGGGGIRYTIFVCISADGSEMRIFLLMPTPPKDHDIQDTDDPQCTQAASSG